MIVLWAVVVKFYIQNSTNRFLPVLKIYGQMVGINGNLYGNKPFIPLKPIPKHVDIRIFDLPTETHTERKVAAKFRKNLLNNGFGMFQYSIYMRFCASRENSSVHINVPKMPFLKGKGVHYAGH